MSRALIRALRSRSIDVLTAREAGLVRIPDEHHLEYATSVGRTVFTFNVRDFARLHAECVLQIGVILRRLLKLLATRSATDMRDWLEYLSNWR
jgi:hypothetical protein